MDFKFFLNDIFCQIFIMNLQIYTYIQKYSQKILKTFPQK
jgi:hypothetical protein